MQPEKTMKTRGQPNGEEHVSNRVHRIEDKARNDECEEGLKRLVKGQSRQ